MTIISEKTLVEQMADALRTCKHLKEPGERRAAYCVAGINFKWRHEGEIRQADGEAVSMEMDRRMCEARNG
jgi:hypothetical protein